MVTFFICLSLLVAAYFIYGKFIENKFVKNHEEVTPPSQEMQDGIDFIPMPKWKTFLIQLLNIAGLGPIFGAVLGAAYGPVAFIWITLGGIFMGSLQDYGIGILSYFHKGKSYPEIVSIYLGKYSRDFIRVYTVLFMVIVGAVFIKGPAAILTSSSGLSSSVWIAIIIAYYILATVLPIDKIIGKVYPIFGMALILMALSILIATLKNTGSMVELTFDSFKNMHFNRDELPIFPTLFVTIACGAISGFHATQSPMMSRCINSVKEARPVFFGAMISESIIALIWAAVGMAFYGGVAGLNEALIANNADASVLVKEIAQESLGFVGLLFVILGVVVAPITSGDTAFRSARLALADLSKIKQDKVLNRVLISIPLFIMGYLLTVLKFDVIWRYFGWGNQVLALFSLWTIDFYFAKNGGRKWYVTIPAIFMTFIVIYYLVY